MTDLYPANFYTDRRRHTAHAAERIFAALPLGLVRDSVADIGCGTGTFLAQALRTGASHAFGVEGDWLDASLLDDKRIVFEHRNLEQRLGCHAVDLVVSLEVAEHLSPDRAATFVGDLCAMAPAVLFSAAIPGQGGVGHLNEQWPSFWAALFRQQGYSAHDIIRPKIWADDAIPAWYRQNTLLFLDQVTAERLDLRPDDPALLDRVHPAFWTRANRELAYANALPESEVLRRQAEAAQQ